MKQADKKLLLKDLCARLPYGVICKSVNFKNPTKLVTIDLDGPSRDVFFCTNDDGSMWNDYDDIKPYLFPISSMTKAQKKKYYSLADDVTFKPGEGCHFGMKIHCIKLGISDNPHEGVWDDLYVDALDWLHKNHFDYRGLIEKGLAIDATNLNIY